MRAKLASLVLASMLPCAGWAAPVGCGGSLVGGATTCARPRPVLDSCPLTVEFEERMEAAGKGPGGFIKREARAAEAATLAARLTDRPIRPLFPEGYKDDIQLVITVLSTDQGAGAPVAESR